MIKGFIIPGTFPMSGHEAFRFSERSDLTKRDMRRDKTVAYPDADLDGDLT
jgi:hypothetical protein